MTAPAPAQRHQDTGAVKGLRFAKVLTWLVYAWFIIDLIVLVLAFFLLLFNASETADFTQWVYRSAGRAMEPFRGIFPSAAHSNGSVIDFSILFAIIVYGILAMLLHSLVGWLDYRIRLRRFQDQHPDQPAPPP